MNRNKRKQIKPPTKPVSTGLTSQDVPELRELLRKAIALKERLERQGGGRVNYTSLSRLDAQVKRLSFLLKMASAKVN